MNEKDVLVKIRRSELTKILEATIEAYNILDEVKREADEVADKVNRAFLILEDIPVEISDIIEEDEEPIDKD